MGRQFSVVGAMAVATAALSALPAPPNYVVDKLWPMPLPEHWILGSVTGMAVDKQNNLWVTHRAASLNARTEAGLMTNPPSAEGCCLPAPPVLRFDAAGKLLGTWGGAGEGYDWPVSTGALVIDDNNNVWITAAGVPEAAGAAAGATGAVPGGGRGGAAPAGGGRAGGAPAAPAGPPGDAHILVFNSSGKFVRQFGKPGQTDASNQANLDKPADVAVDVAANEVYVADGGAHQRVAVLDATTGAFKRQWTGNGGAFQRLSAIALSKDGHVYVGDRKGNKVQVFKKDGAFVSELSVAPKSLGNGSVWDVALSSDAAQQYLMVADGQNETVTIYDRKTLKELSKFGSGGRWPGRFYAINSLAMDSRGTLYTGEGYEGKRVQKFLPQ
jgi:DNA-binding beta-propeller fold protein YncE